MQLVSTFESRSRLEKNGTNELIHRSIQLEKNLSHSLKLMTIRERVEKQT